MHTLSPVTISDNIDKKYFQFSGRQRQRIILRKQSIKSNFPMQQRNRKIMITSYQTVKLIQLTVENFCARFT